MVTSSALICGAGIAGAAAAYWLHRYGYEVTVVERAPAPRDGGQTVDLRGAGRTVVRRMGLLDDVLARCVDQRGIAFVDDRGRVRASLPVDAFGGNGIVSETEILRGDLADVLHSATRADCRHLWDDTVTGLVEHAGGVTVSFERASKQTFDLVVGADGAHSAVRRVAFGPEAEHVRPLGGYQAWFTAPADDGLDGWFEMHRSPGGLVAALRPGRLPGESKAALAFRSAPLKLDRRDLDAVRRLLADRFAGVGWKVPWLLDALRTAPDLAFDSFDQVHMDRWSRGATVLLGDAGYAPTSMSGLGTSLAIVGAYVLTGELARAGREHATAFARYEQIMRPYVAQAQELPPMGMAGFAPSNRFMIGLSSLSMRSMTRWPMRPLVAKHFTKADAIDLPDYAPAAV